MTLQARGGSVPPVMDTLEDLVLELDHVAIAVEDLEASIDWHCSALGFKIIDRRTTTGEHSAMVSAVLKAGRTVVVLVQGVGGNSQISRFLARHGQGVQHMALAVSDLDKAVARLRARGVALDTEIIADDGIRQVFLSRDGSTGVRYELIERRGGTFSDRTVRRLFAALEANHLY